MAIVRVDVVLDRQVLKEVLLLTLESWHIVLVVAKTLKDVGVVVILKDELPDPGGDIEGYCDPGFLSRLFDAGPARIPLPERARIFDTYRCDDCGELAGANWIHIQNGRKLCTDCYDRYDRFHV